MHRFTFSKSLICATLGIISMPSIAALQPASEAALAGETTKTCHFNQDTSSDCSTTYRYTILTNNGREMLSRIDFSFPETDQLEIIDAQSTQPGGKPVALAPTQIDTRMAPNPDQGFQRAQQASTPSPNLRIATHNSAGAVMIGIPARLPAARRPTARAASSTSATATIANIAL